MKTPWGPIQTRVLTDRIIQYQVINQRNETVSIFQIFGKNESLLFGLRPEFSLGDLFAAMEPYGTFQSLKTIYLPDTQSDLSDTFRKLEKYELELDVVAKEQRIFLDQTHYSHLHFYTPSAFSEKKTSTLTNKVQVIPSPFIFDKHAFMLLHEESNILLSHSLFTSDSQSENPEIQLENIVRFHEENVPSSNFLRPLVQYLQSLQISTIIPNSGIIYDKKFVDILFDTFSKLNFFNHFRTQVNVTRSNQIFYSDFLHQLINKLRIDFSDREIMEAFDDTPLALRPETMMIATIQKDDFRLWNQFFEIIYLKKGEKWLNILETTVNKIVEMNDIRKPAIYSSDRIKNQQKIDQLDQSKQRLEQELATLKANLKNTSEKLLKDPLTGNFNEMFLREFLLGEINKKKAESPSLDDISLIYLSVDNLLGINAKYSKEVGDETLVNIAYLINQIKYPGDILFKRNGPGFIILIEHRADRDLYQVASMIQSSIAKSEIFIESITVSLALVQMTEFALLDNPEEIADKMLTAGGNRIKLVHLQGPSSLIDQNTQTEKLLRGSVLLVEDEEIHRKLLTAFLEKANFDVLWASDGVKALEIAKEKPLDAIIVTKNIPKIDGLTIKYYLNESTFTMNTLFILLTYNKTPDVILRANRLGIDHVLEKPLIFDELLGIIQRNKKKRSS